MAFLERKNSKNPVSDLLVVEFENNMSFVNINIYVLVKFSGIAELTFRHLPSNSLTDPEETEAPIPAMHGHNNNCNCRRR